MNNTEMKLRSHSPYNSLNRNEVLRNKFNKRSTRLVRCRTLLKELK